MITKKMNEEANMFANILKKEMANKPAPTLTLHPELTVEKMNNEMTFVRSADPRHPRNFFDHTKNYETAQAFISGTNDNTASYRAKYEGMQDSSGQWQVQTANDLALRNMKNTHKAEMLRTVDIEQRDTLALQHKFEVSYFEAKEARFDFDKRPHKALAPKEVERLEAQAHADFRAFKADKLGILPNQGVKIEPKESIVVSSKQESQTQKPALPSFLDKMEAMRQKSGITQKPTLSRSM
jgi:hypothetical protein